MRTFKLLYKSRLIFYISLIIIFYNEFLVYWQSYFNWPSLFKTDKTDLRLLLVADPQLIGDNDEPWYQESIAKWDSDRYLENTYRLALAHTKPDVIIFLGDLFDEGLKASDEQFQGYYERFSKIFKLKQTTSSTNSTKILYISGDNDIGGEYHNDRSKKLDKRFESYFGSLIDLKSHEYLSFLKLDLDKTSSFYTKTKRDSVRKLIRNNNVESSSHHMIILNHMTIFNRYPNEVTKVRGDF
jgi:hypothetical protein